VVATAPLVSGCAVGGTVVECDGTAYRAQNVHQSHGRPTDIVGKANGKCTAPVALHGYVELQRKNSAGSWYSYKRTTFDFVAPTNKTFTRQAATRCAKGTFRTHFYVVGTYKGRSETQDRVSGATKNPCSK
jgi:hypothetical protein